MRQADPEGVFPAGRACEMFRPMKVSIRLRRLLPIPAIVGLIAGPFTAPVSGVAMAAAADTAMAAMPDDMPCCPDEAPAVPDSPEDLPVDGDVHGQVLLGRPDALQAWPSSCGPRAMPSSPAVTPWATRS